MSRGVEKLWYLSNDRRVSRDGMDSNGKNFHAVRVKSMDAKLQALTIAQN